MAPHIQQKTPGRTPRGSDVDSSRLGYLLAPIISLTFLVSGFYSRDSRDGLVCPFLEDRFSASRKAS